MTIQTKRDLDFLPNDQFPIWLKPQRSDNGLDYFLIYSARGETEASHISIDNIPVSSGQSLRIDKATARCLLELDELFAPPQGSKDFRFIKVENVEAGQDKRPMVRAYVKLFPGADRIPLQRFLADCYSNEEMRELPGRPFDNYQRQWFAIKPRKALTPAGVVKHKFHRGWPFMVVSATGTKLHASKGAMSKDQALALANAAFVTLHRFSLELAALDPEMFPARPGPLHFDNWATASAAYPTHAWRAAVKEEEAKIEKVAQDKLALQFKHAAE